MIIHGTESLKCVWIEPAGIDLHIDLIQVLHRGDFILLWFKKDRKPQDGTDPHFLSHFSGAFGWKLILWRKVFCVTDMRKSLLNIVSVCPSVCVNNTSPFLLYFSFLSTKEKELSFWFCSKVLCSIEFVSHIARWFMRCVSEPPALDLSQPLLELATLTAAFL